MHINAIYSDIGSVDITDDHFLTSGVIGDRGCEGVQVDVEGSCGSYKVDMEIALQSQWKKSRWKSPCLQWKEEELLVVVSCVSYQLERCVSRKRGLFSRETSGTGAVLSEG